MLASIKKHKRLLLWIVVGGVFGIAGLLLLPVFRYLGNLVDRHPKVFKWILASLYATILIRNIFFSREPYYPITGFSAAMLVYIFSNEKYR